MKCYATTNSFMLDASGGIKPCAKITGPVYTTDDFDDYSKINSSPKFIEIKKSLETGVFPLSCESCQYHEDRGLESRREWYDNLGYKEDDFYLDLNPGNFCNLKCRHCNPKNSSNWINEWKHLNIEPEKKYKVNSIDESHIDKICNHILTIKGNINICFKGGEPLIMPMTEILLNRLLSMNISDRLTLSITTNATAVPNYLKDISDKIKQFKLIVSVEGMHDLYQYIRGGQKYTWKTFKENVKELRQLTKVNEVQFNVVVQNYNIHQIPDLQQELLSYHSKDHINYIFLSQPNHLRLNVIPDENKNKIIALIEDYIEVESTRYKKELLLMIKILKETCKDSEYKKFLEFSSAIDNLRTEKGNIIVPHLYQQNY